MATPAYTEFVATNPTGADNGPGVITDILNNFLALRDKVIAGDCIAGFLYSHTGGTAEEPQYFYFKNGSIWYRGTPTWTTGAVSSLAWDWSNDGGGTYAAVLTVGSTVDASGNVTATTGGGGLLWKWVQELLWKFKNLRGLYMAHIAASVSVHGIPATNPIAAQQYTAVNIDGGSIDGTPIGATTPASGAFTRATEQINTYTPGSGAGVTVDWTKGGSSITNSGTNTLTFSNVPAAGNIATHTLYCSNFNSTTFPASVTWGSGGKPSIAGAVICSLATMDGGTTVYGIVAWRAV